MNNSELTHREWSVAAKIFLALAIVGALNWGLVGFFNFNLVDAVLGGGAREETSTASRVLYALVGLAGLAGIFVTPGERGRWGPECTWTVAPPRIHRLGAWRRVNGAEVTGRQPNSRSGVRVEV